MLEPTRPEPTRHPAMFSPPLLKTIANLLGPPPPGQPPLLLDPMGGVGTVGTLRHFGWHVISNEIEMEWACQAPGNGSTPTVGDAAALPYADHSFAAAVTSPAYGNRLADHYMPVDLSARSHKVRRTYPMYLRRQVHDRSAARFHWGKVYKELLLAAFVELRRVLRPDARFVGNYKDHFATVVRRGVKTRERRCLTAWCITALEDLGFTLRARQRVPLRGDQNTNRARQRGDAVIDHEDVVLFTAPSNAHQTALPF